jgi:hypothetical protein
LQHLYIGIKRVPCAGLLHLSKLTSLTTLAIQQTALDDGVAVSMAAALTQLRQLACMAPTLNSTVVLPKVAALSSLVSLVLGFQRGPQCTPGDSELMLLSGLTQLRELHLSPHRCSAEGLGLLLAGMPHFTAVGGEARDEGEGLDPLEGAEEGMLLGGVDRQGLLSSGEGKGE